MDIETIHKKYKFLILNTLTGESELLSSDRLVSKNLKDKYSTIIIILNLISLLSKYNLILLN